LYFSYLVDYVHAHGGDIERFAGDAIICVFCNHNGGTLSLTELTRKAVECGYAIQHSEMNHFQVSKEVVLTIHCAVSTGKLSTLLVGGAKGSWLRITIGDAINNLASALGQSKSGDLVIAKDTYQKYLRQHIKGDIIRETGDFLLRSINQQTERKPLQTVDIDEEMESAMRCFVDPFVISKIDSGQAKFLSAIKPVTIVYISFNIVAKSHNIQYMSMMQNNAKNMQAMLFEQEGSIVNFLCDEKGMVMIFAFGHPTAHENDAARAVGMAFTKQQSRQSNSAPIGIGVASGKCYVGSVGSNQREDFSFMGDAVNLAARLAKKAEGKGEVWCDEITALASGTAFHFEELEPVILKGKAEPIKVRKVTGKNEKQAFKMTLHKRSESTIDLFGRDQELELLANHMSELRQKQSGDEGASLFLIQSEPGCGKTAFVNKIMNNLEPDQYMAAIVTAEEANEKIPFYMIRPILDRVFVSDAIKNGLPAHEAFAKSDAILSSLTKEQKKKILLDLLLQEDYKYAALLNQVYSVDFAETVESQVLDDRKQKTIDMAYHILAVTEQPNASTILSVCENLHFIDEMSLELYYKFVTNKRIRRIFMLMTCRSDADSEIITKFRERASMVINLPKLSQQHCERLISRTFSEKKLTMISSELSELIFRKSESGNPQLVTLTTQFLMDRKLIANVENKLSILGSSNINDIEIPSSVSALIQQKIDRLDPNSNLVVKIASVMGATFSIQVLQEVFPEGTKAKLDLLGHIESLVKAGILKKRDASKLSHEVFEFVNPAIREKAYSMLIGIQKYRVHLKTAEHIASAIEQDKKSDIMQLTEEDQERFFVIVVAAAEHYATGYKILSEAQDEEDNEIDTIDDQEQIGRLEKAIQFVQLANGMLVKRDDKMRSLQLLENSIAMYDIMLRLCSALHKFDLVKKWSTEKAMVHHSVFKIYMLTGLFMTKNMLEDLRAALELCPPDHPVYFEIYSLEWFFSKFVYAQEDADHTQSSLQIIEKALHTGDLRNIVVSYVTNVWSHTSAGQFEMAVKYSNKALELYFDDPILHHLGSINNYRMVDDAVFVCYVMCRVHYYLGNFNTADKMMHSALRFTLERPHGRTKAFCLSQVCLYLCLRHDFHVLESYLKEAVKACEVLGRMGTLMMVSFQILGKMVDCYKLMASDPDTDNQQQVDQLLEEIHTITQNIKLTSNIMSPGIYYLELIVSRMNRYNATEELIQMGLKICDTLQSTTLHSSNIDVYRLKAEILMHKRSLYEGTDHDDKGLLKQATQLLETGLTFANRHNAKLFQLRVLETQVRLNLGKKSVKNLKTMLGQFDTNQIDYSLYDIQMARATIRDQEEDHVHSSDSKSSSSSSLTSKRRQSRDLFSALSSSSEFRKENKM
jgi:class 3 adenylate cyclase/predicted ATPase